MPTPLARAPAGPLAMQPVDVNAGSDDELRARIDGMRIGPDIVERIIWLAERPFTDEADLSRRVNDGIAPARRLGKKKLEKLCVGAAPTQTGKRSVSASEVELVGTDPPNDESIAKRRRGEPE